VVSSLIIISGKYALFAYELDIIMSLSIPGNSLMHHGYDFPLNHSNMAIQRLHCPKNLKCNCGILFRKRHTLSWFCSSTRFCDFATYWRICKKLL